MWEYLKSAKKPIVMYGTGNGADKIFAVLDRLGIEVSDIFASDGFVRQRTFHGKKVISYSDALKKYGNDMIILLAFGSDLPEVTERFFALSQKHELYAPDVPVVGEELFDREFFEKNSDNIAYTRALFADETSKRLYDDIINYRLSGKIEYLANDVTSPDAVMRDILHPESYIFSLDLGAYNGDTALFLTDHAPRLQKVIAIEPDTKNFTKLSITAALNGKIEPHLSAAWDKKEVLLFTKGGGRAIKRAGESQKTVEIAAAPADSFLEGRKPDFIKIDVEGAEREALAGCKSSIKAFSPELQVALYHKSADIFEIPRLIHELNPNYKMLLRRFPSVPAWDINLFCIN